MRFRLRLFASVVAGLLTLGPARASATLGQNVSSIETDRARHQAALVGISNAGAYTVHELLSPSGTSVREFVSPAGVVFGVAWQGPWMPNLQQLLGTSFDRYHMLAAELRAKRRAHGPVVIDTPELSARVSGQPRAFTGAVWVPSLVPAGVQPQSIR